MKNLLATFTLFAFFFAANAQQEVETMPIYQADKCLDLSEEERFSCSNQNIQAYISEIKYPDVAKENKEEGKVFLKFIVSKEGAIEDITVAKSSGSSYLDRAAIHHLSKMPSEWTPATLKDESVDFEFVLPVNFAL